MSETHQKKPIVIAVASSKGGVGKTTIAANLGGYLAELGHKTLMIDGDVQPGLTNYYPIDDVADAGLTALMTRIEVVPQDVVSRISDNLHIVYSDDPNAELQEWVKQTPDGRYRLKKILADRFNEYEFIILDTQGAIGPLQEAVVYAADMIISPVVADKLSASEFLHNTTRMLNKLVDATIFFNEFKVGPTFAVLNKADRSNDYKIYSQEIREMDYTSRCKSPISVLQTEIPDTVDYKYAASNMTPVHTVKPDKQRKMPTGEETMHQLCKELKLI